MRNCNLLERFLDGSLSDARCREFEAHLVDCETCRKAVEEWHSVKQTYADWVEHNTRPDKRISHRMDPPDFVASVLEAMEAGRGPLQTSSPKSLSIYHYVAAAALLLCILGSIYYFGQMERAKPTPPIAMTRQLTPFTLSAVVITDGKRTEREVNVGSDNIIEAPTNGRILASLGDDELGLDRSSRLRVSPVEPDRTELRLTQGRAAFNVSPRPENARFLVKAGEVSVEVIGTRFSVEMDEDNSVIVCVGRGSVSVFSEAWRVKLKAGEAITVSRGIASPLTPAGAQEMETLTRLLSADIHPPADGDGGAAVQLPPGTSSFDSSKRNGLKRSGSRVRNLERWRSLVISGKVRQAEKEIGDYLRTSRRDSEALMLLAICQKKQARYQKAVTSYKRVLTSADEKLSNRARYLAGKLSLSKLRDFHGAVKLLEDYLKHASPGSPNRAEARLMLAKAHIGIGADGRARRVLRDIVKDYGRTPIANRARDLLGRLSSGEDIPQ